MSFLSSYTLLILRFFFFFFLFSCGGLDSVSPTVGVERSQEEMWEIYRGWMAEHKRDYSALGEKERRFQVFKENLRFIDRHNAAADAGEHTFRLGLNHFADLTSEEFRSAYLGGFKTGDDIAGPRQDEAESDMYRYNASDPLPDSVDWRTEGAVTPVQSQGPSCNSSWAFSAVATLEGLNQIVAGNLRSLSVQQLVDCTTSNNKGCQRGRPDQAYKYVVRNGGIDNDEYPYVGHVRHCQKNAAKVVSINGYEYGPLNNEAAIKKAVSAQPVSVAVQASSAEFLFYRSGIFSGSCGTNPDHFVTIVGYGTENEKDYWIIKNSWTPLWGEDGYARIERNVGDPGGKCGIAKYLAYPVKSRLPVGVKALTDSPAESI